MKIQRARSLAAALLLIACVAGVAAQSQKPVLSVLDLRVKDVSNEEMLGIVDGLTAAIFATNSFTVIDRTARDALLGEIEFSMSAAADAESQKSVGKQLSADVVVGGSVSRYEDGRCVLSLRMIDTSSATVIGVSEDLFADFALMLSSLGQQARSLATSARASKSGPRLAISLPAQTGNVFAPLPDRKSFPVQFSIWAPMQLVPAKTAIKGFRLALVYSDNVGVSGFDFGLINRVSGVMSGVQMGLLGFADEARFIQANLVLNFAKTVHGSQIGIVNLSDKCAGMQLGLVNVTGLLRGMQIGLVNVTRYGEGARFMPGVNLSL